MVNSLNNKMNKLIFSTIFLGLLSGCAANQIKQNSASIIPDERAIAFQEKSIGNNAKVVVTKNSWLFSSRCFTSVWIDGVLSARINSDEKAIFYIPSGGHILKISGDPNDPD